MSTPSRGPVLVIEDHPVSRLLFERVLELEEVDVIGAGSIGEAEQLLSLTVPPVIVVDLQLPDGYGLDLVRRLKADVRTSGCAIIACTAQRVPDEERLALEAGCADFVTKPIDTWAFARLGRSLIPAPIPG
jgi:CheY-like chemotaxis protein